MIPVKIHRVLGNQIIKIAKRKRKMMKVQKFIKVAIKFVMGTASIAARSFKSAKKKVDLMTLRSYN